MLSDEAPPVAFARKARELESTLAALSAEASATENALAALARTETPALAETWASLADRTHAMDRDARLKVRQLVADTFARITIYHAGSNLKTDGPHPIEVQLIAKTGRTRTLYVNRKTGAFTAAEDYEQTAAEIPLQ